MTPKRDIRPLPGRLVVFLIGRTDRNLETTTVAEVRTLKSGPSYPDVIPKQKIIGLERRRINGAEVDVLVKAYLPDIVVVEAALDREDILAADTLELKRTLIADCRAVLRQFDCDREFEEEYTVFCIADYSGDPEVYLSVSGGRVAAFLKNEDQPLDEEEVEATLASSLKYGKDDITIVDWDGAFLFDSAADFRANIELFQIANLQLLRSRILDSKLEQRLEKTLRLIRTPTGRLPILRSAEVRRVLKEIIEIRTLSILESEAVEHNIRLIGDWYSARLYSLISRKFHLDDWKSEIKEKLDTLEDVYVMAAENFSVSYRTALEYILLAGWFLLFILSVLEYLLPKIAE